MAFSWTDLIDGVDSASATPINSIGNYLKTTLPSELSALPRLIREITLTEAAATLTISADDDSAAFSLKAARVSAYIPAVGGAYALYAQLNDITDSVYYDYTASPSAASSSFILGIGATLFGATAINFDLLGGNVLSTGGAIRSTSAPVIASTTPRGLLKDGSITGITSIKFWLATGNLPIGTAIRIEGWDA